MNYYFKLQYRIMRRSVEETGLPFFFAPLLLLGFGIALYYVLSTNATLSNILIPYLTISMLLSFAESDRLNFLETIFSKAQFKKIRLFENSFAVLPICLLSLVCQYWSLAILNLILLCVFTYFKPKIQRRKSFPTPFRRYPFEFIVFFRKRLWVLLLLGGLMFIGLYVGNANLSLVAFGITVLMVVGETYNTMESEMLLWNYNRNAVSFLKHKFYRGCLQFSALLMPFFLVLLAGIDEKAWWVPVLLMLAGNLLLLLIVLMKYAAYPRPVGLLESFIFILAALMPIGIVFLYPYYFLKAKRNLKKYDD